nr:unnamed protein product [Callosobruchus chinensis]
MSNPGLSTISHTCQSEDGFNPQGFEGMVHSPETDTTYLVKNASKKLFQWLVIPCIRFRSSNVTCLLSNTLTTPV